MAGVTDLSRDQTFTTAQVDAGREAERRDPTRSVATSLLPRTALSFSRVKVGLISLLLTIGTLPLAVKFLSGLGDRPQYEFYPLLLIATAALLFDQWDEITIGPLVSGNQFIGAGSLILALLLASAGNLLYVRWLGWPALLVMLAGIVWCIGGLTLFRRLLPCLILLLTILPPPGRYDQFALTQLQRLAVKGSSRLLDLLSVPNLVSGTTIEIPGHRLLVEQACSGINSVVSISAFTLLYGFYHRRSAVRLIALLGIAVFFILLVNLFRIVLGAVLLDRWNINLLEPSVHATVGFAMFLIGLGLTLSADQLLELIGDMSMTKSHSPKHSPPAQTIGSESNSKAESQAARRRHPFAGWSMVSAAGLSVLLGGWSFARLNDCWPASHLSGAALFAPPAQVGSWQLVEGAGGATQRIESVARYQQRWVYHDGQDVAEVSLAYPFNALYHDASECYQYTGWHVEHRSSALDSAGVTNTVQLTKAGEANALLLFGAFDEAGRADLPVDRSPNISAVMQRLALSREAAMHHPTCEVQTLQATAAPLDERSQLKLRQLFTAVRNELQSQVVRQANP